MAYRKMTQTATLTVIHMGKVSLNAVLVKQLCMFYERLDQIILLELIPVLGGEV